jgi:hypothetical protein
MHVDLLGNGLFDLAFQEIYHLAVEAPEGERLGAAVSWRDLRRSRGRMETRSLRYNGLLAAEG